METEDKTDSAVVREAIPFANIVMVIHVMLIIYLIHSFSRVHWLYKIYFNGF